MTSNVKQTATQSPQMDPSEGKLVSVCIITQQTVAEVIRFIASHGGGGIIANAIDAEIRGLGAAYTVVPRETSPVEIPEK